MYFFSLALYQRQREKKYFTPQLALIEHQILLLLQIHFEDCRGLSSYNRASRRDKSKGVCAILLVLHTSLDHTEKCTEVLYVILCQIQHVSKLIRSTSMHVGRKIGVRQIFQSFSNKDLTEHCEGFSMTH